MVGTDTDGDGQPDLTGDGLLNAPFMTFDLGADVDISYLRLYWANGDASQSQHLGAYEIYMSNNLAQPIVGAPITTGTQAQVGDLYVDIPAVAKGQYVTLRQTGTCRFSAIFAEVQAWYIPSAGEGNIQSVINGVLEADLGASAAADATTPNQWFMVDMGASYDVTNVVIYNRGEQYFSRLGSHSIRIGDAADSPGTAATVCEYTAPAAAGPFDEACVGTGRYVYVYRNAAALGDAENRLSLREIYIYGSQSYSSLTWGGVATDQIAPPGCMLNGNTVYYQSQGTAACSGTMPCICLLPADLSPPANYQARTTGSCLTLAHRRRLALCASTTA